MLPPSACTPPTFSERLPARVQLVSRPLTTRAPPAHGFNSRPSMPCARAVTLLTIRHCSTRASEWLSATPPPPLEAPLSSQVLSRMTQCVTRPGPLSMMPAPCASGTKHRLSRTMQLVTVPPKTSIRMPPPLWHGCTIW